MCGHSPAAALVDACECAACGQRRSEGRVGGNIDQWWMFTIRSRDAIALNEHRKEMMDLGWTAGPIGIGESWSAEAGRFIFSARKPKAAVSDSEMESLVQWDALQGE